MPNTNHDVTSDPDVPPRGTITHAPADTTSEAVTHAPAGPGAKASSEIAPGDATPRGSGEGTIDHTPSVTSGHAPTPDDDPKPAAAPRGKAARTRAIDRLPGYEILGELGRGGMGVVYQARHLKLDRLVAVKVMLNADHAGTTARERFDAEARAIAQMQHPNIVQLFEVGEVDGKPFFSLEYVAGGTLSDRVAQNLLPAPDTAALMVTLARAMNYAHEQGIIHRDLKPGNILLTGEMKADSIDRSSSSRSAVRSSSSRSAVRGPYVAMVPKITDFGLAKKIEEDSAITRAGAVVGTPSYMPPEQASGQAELVGPLADVYALGAILYDLLTGRPPFKGANVLDTLNQVRTQEPLAPSSLQPGVPKDLETICLKCLQKDPAKRYQTAGALGDDLQRYLNHEPILARPIGAGERAWRWCKRNPRVAGLLATVAGLLLLIAAGSSAAAVFVNQQKQTIAGQLDVITAKERETAAQKTIAEENWNKSEKNLATARRRFTQRQSSVDTFVNEAPGILEGNPLAAGPNAELLGLLTTLLEDAEGDAEDRALTDRGRLALVVRRAEAASAKAMSNPGGGIDPRALDEADRYYEDALKLAEALDRPGSPERDKAAGNRANILKSRAAIHLLRRGTTGDPDAVRKYLAEAVRLNTEALRVERRVLDAPESGEIPAGEVRTWLGKTHLALAEAHQFLALTAATPEDARAEFLFERDHARQAEEHLTAGLASGALTPRVKTRTAYFLAKAALEAGRADARLDDLDGATAGYGRAADRMGKLVAESPANLLYRQDLAIISAEFGDFLLMRKKDAAAAKQMYTLSVVHLRPVAQPPELARPVNNLALNYYRIATATLKTGDTPNAVRLYGLCLETREAQLRDAERLAASRKDKDPAYLISAKINVMLAQARVGKYKEAAAFAQELAEKFPGNRRWLFQAACGFALSSAAVPESEAKLKAEYLRRSIECLDRAADNGYDDQAALESDPDLDPVRADPRFPSVLERVKLLRGKK